MKHLIITRGDTQYLTSMLNNRKIEHEIYKSIPLLEMTYVNRDLRGDKVLINDSIFDDLSNMFNDLERLHELVITPYFRYTKLIFVVSDRQDATSLLEMINSIFEDISDKVDIHKLSSVPTVSNIFNILLDKADSLEEIQNRYEEVIKQRITSSGGPRMAAEMLKMDIPGTSTISTVDMAQILMYQSVMSLISKSEVPSKTVATEFSSRAGLGKEALASIEPIVPLADKPENTIIILGERSSGKFTFTTALATSLFQNEKSSIIFDLTDSSTMENIKHTDIDCTCIDVRELLTDPEQMSKDMNRLSTKMINIVTGGADFTHEYSHIINNMPSLNFDFKIYVINVTRLEMLDLANFKKIFAVTSSQPKYMYSLARILKNKFDGLETDIDLSIVPVPMHTEHSDVVIPDSLIGDAMDDLYYTMTAEEKNRVSIAMMDSPVQIDGLNVEGKFALDLLGGSML